MRISVISSHINADAIKKIDQERKSASITTTNKANKDSSVFSDDAKRLSASSADVGAVKAQAEAHPEIRPEKVQEAKQKIQSGFYDSEEFIDQLAEKIMRDFGIG
ncbi:MAG: hypothetical protein A2350_04985 [Candidatus Raymondbacteria bacterium RifOxyB12_full_50_8]|nr:MAG: hypothetical protein A2350_04985 [Candidatus Raymondbacteria bacterium RifOxyB12_full_50_8]